MKKRVTDLLMRIKCNCLGHDFNFIVNYDQKANDGERLLRVFIQLQYKSLCSKTGSEDYWKGRKWYLSEHMSDDEIVKTAYSAFKSAVTHEVMEGFKIDGVILFNPHVNFEELLKISSKEVKRV